LQIGQRNSFVRVAADPATLPGVENFTQVNGEQVTRETSPEGAATRFDSAS
jgi:hypothetical protein